MNKRNNGNENAESVSNSCAVTSTCSLDQVLAFIGGASPQQLRRIVRAVREAWKRHSVRTQFKPGDSVEWEIERTSDLAEYFRGHVLKTNVTTCSVMVKNGNGPMDHAYYKVPLELLRHCQARGQDDVEAAQMARNGSPNAAELAIRQRFRTDQMVEWNDYDYPSEVWCGQVLRVNRTTCTVAMPNRKHPSRTVRVPFEWLRPAE